MKIEIRLRFEEQPTSVCEFYSALKPSLKYLQNIESNCKCLRLIGFQTMLPCLNSLHARKVKIWAIFCDSSSEPLFILLALRSHKPQCQYSAHLCIWIIIITKRHKFSLNSFCYIFPST